MAWNSADFRFLSQGGQDSGRHCQTKLGLLRDAYGTEAFVRLLRTMYPHPSAAVNLSEQSCSYRNHHIPDLHTSIY